MWRNFHYAQNNHAALDKTRVIVHNENMNYTKYNKRIRSSIGGRGADEVGFYIRTDPCEILLIRALPSSKS